MRIWIFNHYAISSGASGPTRHFDMSRELVKQGHDVTIFASSFDHQTRQEKHLPEPGAKMNVERCEGVEFVWVKTTPYQKNNWRRVLNMLTYTTAAYRAAKTKQERPDVIIGSLMHPLAAVLGYVMARIKKCRFYFEERDLWPQSLIDLGKVSKRNPIVWLLSWLELCLYKKSDGILVLFHKAGLYVTSRGIDPKKVLYLPNGVSLRRYAENRMSLPPDKEAALAQLEGKFLAIYTGAHSLANRLDSILDTAKRLVSHERIHFLLVGDGPDKAALIERKEREGLTNVTFLPPVPKDAIPQLLQKAHVGMLALHQAEVYKWGISVNKTYDYMASSLPILLLSELAEMPIHQFDGGLMVPTPDHAAETLMQWQENPHLLRALGERSRTYVEQHHDWETLSQKLAAYLANQEPTHETHLLRGTVNEM